MGNAVKFTSRGEVFVQISAETRDAETCILRVFIRDTGIGIPEEAIPRLFELFSQVDASTTRKFGGTGLGLAISKRLSELMGGDISVESTLGVGSSFEFTLLTRHVTAPCNDVPASFVNIQVLVALSSATQREIAVSYLRSMGCVCDTAGDARETLKSVRDAVSVHRPYDVIFIDQEMPVISGDNLAGIIEREFGKFPKRVVIVARTGARSDTHRHSESGICGVIVKPLKRAKLFEIITTCLAAATESSLPRSDIEGHPARDTSSVQSARILFAEDNPVNQLVVKRILEKEGLGCEIVNNGMEAVQAFEMATYDIIFMDVQMPILSGYDATRTIRELEEASGGHIPIVAMTANAMKGDREKCLEFGMGDYVSKPINRAEFLRVLERWLRAKA